MTAIQSRNSDSHFWKWLRNIWLNAVSSYCDVSAMLSLRNEIALSWLPWNDQECKTHLRATEYWTMMSGRATTLSSRDSTIARFLRFENSSRSENRALGELSIWFMGSHNILESIRKKFHCVKDTRAPFTYQLSARYCHCGVCARVLHLSETCFRHTFFFFKTFSLSYHRTLCFDDDIERHRQPLLSIRCAVLLRSRHI